MAGKKRQISCHAFSVLKGAVEHGDTGHYFGSLIGLRDWMNVAVKLGFLDSEGNVTDFGRRVYVECGLGDLPRAGRAYMWLPDPWPVVNSRFFAMMPTPVVPDGCL